jgi:hypothetical protein
MRMTWTPTPVRDEQAFAAIKGGIDALPPGVKMFLNSCQWVSCDPIIIRLNTCTSLQPSSMDKA